MSTPSGWRRAQLQLNNIDVKYNSIKEAYFMSALQKKNQVEALKHISSCVSAFSGKAEAVKDSLNEYLEEMFPDIKEERNAFIEQAQNILDNFAGKSIEIGGEKE